MKVDIGDFTDNPDDRKVEVRIDRWDTYEARSTLCEIIIPLLKQFKEDKKATAWIENEDVPWILATTGYSEDKWNYVIDEMIWAFETIHKDELDLEHWEGSLSNEDYEAAIARKKEGLRLFAKYFESLWW